VIWSLMSSEAINIPISWAGQNNKKDIFFERRE
jgi:hypothetical protein